jgi:uncharacterized YccA/Bax inhibitor family protein
MRTSNPVLNESTFARGMKAHGTEVMTIDGTVNKCLIALALMVASGYWAWNDPTFAPLVIPGIIATFVLALVLAFKQSWAPTLTPVYAVLEGFILGVISRSFEAMYPGIVGQAVFITFGVFACLLIAYKSRWIRVSEKFKSGLLIATGGIALFYIGSFIASLFGVSMNFMQGSSMLSIGISLVVAGVAALNLLLDFDLIENASASRSAPKYMEWYATFGLLVTLVWLYMEILRLLAKLNSRRD